MFLTMQLQSAIENYGKGCISPAWKLYVFQFQLLPLDVPWGGGEYHHQMWLVGLWVSQGMGIPKGVPYLSHNARDIATPTIEQNDRHLWKHYLPATSLGGRWKLIC